MSKRNATASWSGYSYQGQVGLLVALRKMKEVQENEYSTYFLEYENKEDVAIYRKEGGKDDEYLSVHQVKAYYSNNNDKKSKYNKVLNNDFDICGNDFLHTVVNIDDWDTSETTNNNSIKRYEYSEDVYYCGTTEIESLLIDEITLALDNDRARATIAYQRLTLRLDSKIREEHQKGSKPLFDISFSFSQLEEIIKDTVDFSEKFIYDSRRAFYELFIEIVQNQNIEEEHLKNISKNIIEEIYNLNDEEFLLFLKRLNLNEKPERLSMPQFNFNATGLKQVFFKVLVEVLDTTPKIEEESVKYLKEGKSEHFVLTSINEEENDKKIVIENIIRNMESQDILWDNHALVNKEINGIFSELNPDIKNIAFKGDNNKNKFMGFSSRSRLVDRDITKDILNDE